MSVYEDLRILLEGCLLEKHIMEMCIGMTASKAREIKILIANEPGQINPIQENARLELLHQILHSQIGQLIEDLRETEADLIQTRRNLDETLFEMSRVNLNKGQWVEFGIEDYSLVSFVLSPPPRESAEQLSTEADKGK